MNSPAHDIALYLDDMGVGVFGSASGWAIAVGAEPATPDDAITIYDTGGEDPDTDELDVDRTAIQVRVRSASYTGAYAKQDEIKDILILTQPIAADTSLLRVMMTSDIMSLGRDDNNRHVLTSNYRTRRARTAGE